MLLPVVSFFFSTSNHNYFLSVSLNGKLYHSSFLHQTTTHLGGLAFLHCCIILLFYIKPQRVWWSWYSCSSCIILLFYIKPQLPNQAKSYVMRCIILLFYIKPQLSRTSPAAALSCIILLFYIKPQLSCVKVRHDSGCIILLFYIKPQLSLSHRIFYRVVSFFFSTSNHNYSRVYC